MDHLWVFELYTAVERMVETLFEDIFRVDQLDPDGKKFDRGNSAFISSPYFSLFWIMLKILLESAQNVVCLGGKVRNKVI